MNSGAEPLGIRHEDGKLHIEGYPTAERIVELGSPLAKRLADLRLHQGALMFCEGAMQEFGRLDPNASSIPRAALYGIVTKFFSCFADNGAAKPLNPDRVFKGIPGAKDGFVYWKNIRNKHISHNESEMSFVATCLVLDSSSDVMDVVSLNMHADFTGDREHCQLLYTLIDITLKFVVSEVENLLPRVFEEARAMTRSERAALPGLVYVVPKAEHAAVTRKRQT